MSKVRLLRRGFIGLLIILSASFAVSAQIIGEGQQFGPVVRAYLGYLRNEQEVVDDRVSKHEVTVPYYRRNSNRIRALRQVAVQIARDTQNDYLPELEAVAGDELHLLFERPPRSQTLRVGEVVQATFRYLGVARTGEVFYVFARLDPYEQAEQMERVNHSNESTAGATVSSSSLVPRVVTRARRVAIP